jgi:hypothetical protein
MVSVPFDTVLKDFDGRPVKHNRAGELVDATLKGVAVEALLLVDAQGLSADEHLSRYGLAQRIHKANGAGVELTVEEIALVKRLLAKGYTPGVVGAAVEILDPASLRKGQDG